MILRNGIEIGEYGERIAILNRLMDMRETLAAFVFVLLVIPFSADAAMQKSFEVSGWIPYWRAATGTADVMPNLDTLTEVNPFVYTLKSDGTFLDNGKLDQEPWLTLRAEAKKRDIRFIPTVMTSNGALVHELLSDKKKRIALAEYIVGLVKEKDFDGIDIDFEGKKSITKDYFSTFLKGLDMRMGDKWIMCTIESRTPLGDRYYGTDIPADAGMFANDLKTIGQYCDRVRIMAYDQQGIDQKLATTYASSSQLYAPVGDPAWVEKVVHLFTKEIPKNKLMIGVPTYGYEYDVRAYAGPQYVYDILWTFNPGYATTTAAERGVVPTRAPWGEMYFTYVSNAPTTSPPVSLGPNSALLAAAAATTYANNLNSNLNFRLMVWPDAESVRQKVELARKLGVRGISVFKFDGGQDPNMWNVFRTNASPAAPARAALARNLALGATGEDVRTLQIILNADPDTQIAVSGAGSPGSETVRLGPLTVQAVQKFQMKYGIATKGHPAYGFVGPATRAKLNTLLQ